MTREQYQGSEAWHAERRSGYGASDAPVLVLGTEADWRQLHGEKLGLIPPREATETMDLGKRLEGVILKAAAERSGPIVRVNRIVRHPELPYVFASLDGRRKRGDRRPVEVKKWGWKGDDWGPAGSDIIPLRILYQVQQQAAVTGADAVDVIVLFGGSKIEEFTVGFDRSIVDELIGLETAAWAFVERGEMPPFPGEAPKRIVLAHDEVALDGMLTAMVAEYDTYRTAAKVAETDEETARSRIREYLADAGGAKGVLPDGRTVSIAHRPQEPRTTVAWELVAKAYRQWIEDTDKAFGFEPTLLRPDLDAIESMFTSTAAPIRPLRVTIGKGKQ